MILKKEVFNIDGIEKNKKVNRKHYFCMNKHLVHNRDFDEIVDKV